MLQQNIKEYENIRQNIEAIRNRLTTHLSFAIGGSGLFYISINSFEKYINNYLTLSMICAFSALMISAFFYLALYKFNSVNRFCGYAKLINIELRCSAYDKSDKVPSEIHAWEICVALLAHSKKITIWNEKLEKYFCETLKYRVDNIEDEEVKKTINLKFNEYNLSNTEIDKDAIRKGWKMLKKGIKKKDDSKSWKYPLYTSYIYYVLIFFFLGVSMIGILEFFNHLEQMELLNILELNLIVCLWIVIIKVIINSFADLYKLMLGSRTISAYCWKFFPYRVRILNKFNIVPTYYWTEKYKNSSEILDL